MERIYPDWRSREVVWTMRPDTARDVARYFDSLAEGDLAHEDARALVAAANAIDHKDDDPEEPE